jgi:hypothetical protein
MSSPLSADELAVQKHLSRVYARVAGATMSSINSIIGTQPSPSIKFEGGLLRSNRMEVEVR